MDTSTANFRTANSWVVYAAAMSIGDIIRAAREKRGWTQKTLAHKVGLRTASAVSQWENGNTAPLAAQRLMVARVLEIPLESLYEFSKERAGAGAPPPVAAPLLNLLSELEPQDAEVLLLLAEQLAARKKKRAR